MNNCYSIKDLSEVFIGYPTENGTRQITIDVSGWLSEFPQARIDILYSRPTEDGSPYLVSTVLEDGLLTWNISDTDVEKEGYGYAILQMTDQNRILRSAVFGVRVGMTLKGSVSPTPPPAAPSWVQQILDSRAENFYIYDGKLYVSKVDGTIEELGDVKGDPGETYDDTELRTRVRTIEDKIPDQASSSNKLADKNFVNSSISTNTANYISNNGEPFDSFEQLEAYAGPITNNDYAFVTGIDESGNAFFDRYKATVSGSNVSWAKEFRLNNSSFTAEQWAAISSGITASKVAEIENKVDKFIGNKNVIYAHTGNLDTTIDYTTDDTTSYSIVQRNASGQFSAESPTNNKHVVNKTYAEQSFNQSNIDLFFIEITNLGESDPYDEWSNNANITVRKMNKNGSVDVIYDAFDRNHSLYIIHAKIRVPDPYELIYRDVYAYGTGDLNDKRNIIYQGRGTEADAVVFIDKKTGDRFLISRTQADPSHPEAGYWPVIIKSKGNYVTNKKLSTMTESWTFTLDDDTVVTKKVVVVDD